MTTKLYQSHANRGKSLEDAIDRVNRQYMMKGIGDIRKVPVPAHVHKFYTSGKLKGKFLGSFKKGEWVDYVGIAQGRGIAFDAKETSEKTRFPLKNIHEHQMNFLRSWRNHKAYTFLIISFVKNNHEIYLVSHKQVEQWWIDKTNGGRKSIPYDWFVENCLKVKPENGYILHYLKYCV